MKRSEAKLPAGGAVFCKPRRIESLAPWHGWLDVSVTNALAERAAS